MYEPKPIIDALRQAPISPFHIKLTNSEIVPVSHPERVWVMPTELVVAKPSTDQQRATIGGFSIIGLDHVVQIHRDAASKGRKTTALRFCFSGTTSSNSLPRRSIACPSQEVEGNSAVNADFWHPVRESLQAKYGKQLHVLGWTGASGDQSPHLMFRKRAEDRMRQLRGLTRLEELSRRVVAAWEEAYEGAKQESHADALLVHRVEIIELPLRKVTEEEYNRLKSQVEESSKDPTKRRWTVWQQSVVNRYLRQEAGQAEPYRMELHTIRLGDIAIATNAFELFTDYGIQIKARSRALQTFLIQLAGPGTYIPTEQAARGGGYSAIVESNDVGAEGGQVLTEATIERLNALWPDK